MTKKSPYIYYTATLAKNLGYALKDGYGTWVDTRKKDSNGKYIRVPCGKLIKNSDGSYILLNSDGTASVMMRSNGTFTEDGELRSILQKANMRGGGVNDTDKNGKSLWREDWEKDFDIDRAYLYLRNEAPVPAKSVNLTDKLKRLATANKILELLKHGNTEIADRAKIFYEVSLAYNREDPDYIKYYDEGEKKLKPFGYYSPVNSFARNYEMIMDGTEKIPTNLTEYNQGCGTNYTLQDLLFNMPTDDTADVISFALPSAIWFSK